MIKKSIALMMACLLTAGCSSAGSTDAQELSGAAAMAVQTVATHLGVPAAELKVVSDDAVDFSDSSLGCPQPGMSYLQVITPGHKVVVDYAGQMYDVRVSGGRAFICETSRQ